MRHTAIEAPRWLACSSIYQINPRTFCPEGTIAAVTRELPKLAELGFGVMYLCPIFEADDSADIRFFSERQKKYGTQNPKNPYRMNDYFAIDSEYGTMEDLKAFVQESHRLGMRVLLDLVYLHIGPNAPILKRHPEFAQQDEKGNIINGPWHFPLLDFNCLGLREYLWSNMTYYVGVLDVDGFRCDVGDDVPLDFWVEGRRRMKAIKPDSILIDEGDNGEYLLTGFDSIYAFRWHEMLYQVFNGAKPASALREDWEQWNRKLPLGARVLRDMDNHDTVTDWPCRVEKMAGHEGMEIIQALNYTMDGIPMVYCGNELADSARINMFANRFYPGVYEMTDRNIAGEPWSLRRQEVMKKLNRWKKESELLYAGSTRWLTHDQENDVIAVKRETEKESLLFIANVREEEITVYINEEVQETEVFLQNGDVKREDRKFVLSGHSYMILTR